MPSNDFELIKQKKRAVTPKTKGKSKIFYVFIIVIVLGAGLWRHFNLKNNTEVKGASTPRAERTKEQIIEESYISTLNKRISDNLVWEANIKETTASQLLIAGKSGLVVNVNSQNILFNKDHKTRRPIASLVKIMTAVVALEHADVLDSIKVDDKAATVGENSMGISGGETYTLEELLYGLILVSGNDAAYAIADGLAGNSDVFVGWMNIKSKELGMSDTYFADPSGLDDSSYSTPYDLAKLSVYAMKSPVFKKIAATVEKELVSEQHKYIYLENQTNLLTTYPGVGGIKTGYTEEAGLCLVTYSMNNDVPLIGVVLDSIDRKGDMILMLDYAFSLEGINIDHPALVLTQ